LRAYPQQVLRYAGSIFPGIVGVVAGEIHNRAETASLADRLAEFVGREMQFTWYRRFAQAVADDPNLKRPQAAEKVLRAAWSEYSQAQLGQPAAASAQPAAISATFLKPAETAWCDQCDQQVSGAHAGRCSSPFCKLKIKEAA
jgi:hypothetical protein